MTGSRPQSEGSRRGNETQKRLAKARRKVSLTIAARLPSGFTSGELLIQVRSISAMDLFAAEGLDSYQRPETVDGFLREWVKDGLLVSRSVKDWARWPRAGIDARHKVCFNRYYWVGEPDNILEVLNIDHRSL